MKQSCFRHIKLFVSLSIIWMGCCAAHAQPENEFGMPIIKNYIPKVYKGYPQIFGITQDKDGFLYFTGNGITEYDGKTWRRIPPLGAATWSIVPGNDNRLYVGGTNDFGYVQEDTLGKQQYISLLPLLPEKDRTFGQLRHAAVLGDEIFFASKAGYLIRYHLKKQTARIRKEAYAFSFMDVVHGKLYLGLPGKGLATIIGNEIIPILDKDILATAVLPYQDDALLISTKGQGLFLYKNEEITPFQTEADELLSGWTYCAGQLPDGSYAFSIIDKGLVILDHNGNWLRHLDKTHGLLDNIITSIHADASGTLWLGTNSGLCQLGLGLPFSKFNTDDKGVPLFVEDIMRFDGQLYVASASTNGLLYLDKKAQVFRKLNGLMPGQGFGFSSYDNRFFGMGHHGIYEIQDKNAMPVYREKDDNFYARAGQQSQLNEQYFFLGLQNGLAALVNKKSGWSFEGRHAAIPEHVGIKRFLESEPGKIWVSTENQGLWSIRYQDNPKTQGINITGTRSFSNGIPDRELGSTGVYDIGGKPVFTGAGGIFNFEETHNQLIPDHRFPLPDSPLHIQQVILAEHDSGDVFAYFLFFSGSATLGTYRKTASGSYIFDQHFFGAIPQEDLLNISKLYPESDGVVWIGGQEGIFRFDTQQTMSSALFPIKIRNVYVNEDSLLYAGHGVTQKPVLTYQQNDISFNFLAVNFNIDDVNQYQTQLEGFDPNWSEWSIKTERTYTNLPEGDYVFRIRGKTSSGAAAQAASYSFSILPPWWRTSWAYLCYVCLGGGILYFFSQWRNRHHRERSKQLETTVNERTKELELRLEELSAIINIQEGLVAQMEAGGIYQLIGNQIRDLFKADMVYIAILNKEKQTIHFPYGYGGTFSSINYGMGLTSQIIREGKSLLVNKGLAGDLPEGKTSKVVSFLGGPIPLGKEVIGVIGVQSFKEANRFNHADERLLNTIAKQAGVALHNAQLFREAEQARATAEEANEAKSTFLSTVSHELRTPLTSVIGFAKIIKKRLEERILPFVQSEEKKTGRAIKQVTQNLDIVVSEGERLTTLINTVLDLAKIEAGRLDWNIGPIHIGKIIQQATAATASLFEQKSLSLRMDIPDTMPEISGDKDRLVQVMINLISNAVKFTDSGEINIKTELEDRFLVVSVKDDGIGISKADLPKVFEKFKQVGDTLTDKPKGTGLGLPICKEIVEYHNGQIWAESKLGEGSTFFFSLPLTVKEKGKGEALVKSPEDNKVVKA